MDIIYPVRPGEVNEELRFSLRTLDTHYPDHGTIWIVGYRPSWLTGVEVIPGGNPTTNSRRNVYQNILTACRHPDVSTEAVVFNDDFFLTEPIDSFPVAYRSTLREHMHLPRLRTNPRSWWRESLSTTMVCLQALGYPDPLSYELHVPFPVNTGLMAETLERFNEITPDNPPQWRSLYGNLHVTDPVQMADSKVFRNTPIRRPFHSTTDLSWKHFRGGFAARFPDPSRYERLAKALA